MKQLLILILCACVTISAYSQDAPQVILQGTVSDSLTKQPLEFVAVSLYHIGATKPVTGTITDATGKFVISDAEEGTYKLLIESINYNPVTINNVVLSAKQKLTDLGMVHMMSTTKSLDEVVVTTQAKVIDNRIDRMVFNAEKDVSSQTGTAADVLKKVPQVAVDADGNVQLAGSGGVRFLINGKPSTAFGSSVADVLQSIPASQIKSIEVITNPGAKYDAQGLGGIINIILKSSKAKGYNGNLSLTAGTRQENGSFNVNVRNKNVGLNAFVSGNKRLKSEVGYTSERTTVNGADIDYLYQSGLSQFTRQGMQAGMGFDWTLDKLNSITASLSSHHFSSVGAGTTSQEFDINKGSGIPAIFTQVNSASDSKFNSTDLSLNYKRTFSKEGRELEASMSQSYGNSRTKTLNEQIALPGQAINYATQSINPGKEKETEINLDYTEPIRENIILSLGGEYSFDDISSQSSADKYDPATLKYAPDNSLSTSLDYRQQIYAGYAEMSFPLFAGITAKAGGRYERTEINAYFSNAQQQKDVPGYNTFVPSLYLSKKLDDKQNIKLSYSKRIERPGYNDLNPFVNTTDPKNLSTGNANLLPEIGHRMEFTYSRDMGKIGSGMVNLFYRINEDDIQSYVLYYPRYQVGDSVYENVSVSTRRNIGSERNIGANIFSDLHINSKFGLRGNLFMFRRHTINMIDQGFNTNSFNYRFNLNASYQFNPTLVGEMFGNFNSARHEAQGIYPSFTTYNLAIRKQFWAKKGSLALTANNFLAKDLKQETKLFGPGYNSLAIRRIPMRSIGLNFTWKFGKLEFKRERNEEMNPAGE